MTSEASTIPSPSRTYAPDRGIRNGQRSLEIATAVYAREPTAVHAETVALALAELERCAEAVDLMRRAIAYRDSSSTRMG